MATFLLTKNRTRRVLGLLAGLALIIGAKSSATSAAVDTPTAVKFTILNTCAPNFGGTGFDLRVGGQVIGTMGAGNDCTCGPALRTYTATDATTLGLVGTPGCTDVSVTMVGSSYMAWSRAEITRSVSGTETICINDYNGGNCTEADLCNAGFTQFAGNTVFASAPADTNGNGINDCQDPDIDGDGVLNAADNCPTIVNPGQADSDNNGVGNACQPNVVAVPWLGSEAQPHQVYSGGALVLQASAYNPATGNAITLTSGTWDAGDGSGPQAINVSNSLNLELAHTYTGAVGQPFTATIAVFDGVATYTDTFKVVIGVNNLDTKVNMAIDKGLWNLHKTLTRNTVEGQPGGFWTGQYNLAATASSVQAFEINNHRESGDATKDPYVNDVARGLKYILSAANIQKVTGFGMQGANDPDANGNGFGLWVNNNDHSSYMGGQVIDAIVASGTKTKVAVTGVAGVIGRQYIDIVQDLLDGYSYGIADNTGGFHYGFQGTTGSNDVSASHWWGIGVLASHTWGLDAPAWVKNLNWTVGTPNTQTFFANQACVSTANGSNGDTGDGHFGYTDSKNWLWDNGTNTTAAGLVLLNADGIDQTHPRYTCASQFLKDRYNTSMGNFYTMYQTTKAMRTAINGAGVTTPITNLGGTVDWYTGYATFLVGNQNAAGGFSSNATGSGGTNDMNSSWAIIILSPALFEAAPNAVCAVDSSIVCAAGAQCGATQLDAYATANFSGSQSTPGDNPIASYAWNFQDSTTASGVAASHQFSAIGSFPVKLTVTDTKGNASSATCTVTVTDTALPPVASTGGPYEICVNRAGSVVLDASGSIGRGANIVSYGWDFTTPVNFAAIDASAASTDQTAYFRGLGVGTHDVAVRISDDSLSHFTTTAYSTVTVLAANDPKCNANPAASDNTYTMAKNTTLSGNAVTDGTADSDADGDTFTAAVVAAPAQGTLTFNANGSFSYTPTANFDGVVTFTYKLTDQFGGTSNTATVTITVIANTPPAAVNDTASTQSGTPVTITVLTNDSDAEGDGLSVTSVSAPSNGGVVINGDGTVTYTPANGFAGVDSFTYTISDGHGGTATATVTVTVTKRAATVTAGDGTKVYGTADPAIGATSTGFLAADGITVSATRAAGETIGSYVTTATATGDVSNYDVTYVAGSVTITKASLSVTANDQTRSHTAPNPTLDGVITGVTGGDTITATYAATSTTTPGTYPIVPTLVDPNGRLSNYTVTIVNGTLTVTNGAPVAVANTYMGPWNTLLSVAPNGVIGNDTDVDHDPLTATLVTSTTHGVLSFNANGGFTYMPNPNYSGNDTFSYSVSDGIATSNTVTVTLTITSPCRVERDDDRHGDGDGDDHDRRRNGHREGDGCEHDRHNRANRERDREGDRDHDRSFESDDCARGTAIAKNDKYSTKKDTTLTVTGTGVRGNDKNAASVSLLSSTSHGTLALAANGTFVYTPAAGFTGVDTFVYVARNSAGAAGPFATVTITVKAHWEGDNCDHDKGKKGHKEKDNCDHDKYMRADKDRD